MDPRIVDLERRLRESSAQLEAAHKAFDSFSYAVSHDLRGPLRAVDGFSQALLEDFGAQLPEEGQFLVRTVREGAQQLGDLLDDLQKFSRWSRQPLQRENVSANQQVQEALEELDAEREGRPIEIKIEALPDYHATPNLMRQVWVNLLSNAFKFTGKREQAAVEVGFQQQSSKAVYFVRDNGAGFDMRYVDRLCGVFQRLHRPEEFSGRGMGLAIVQRILHRHGGEVWAEAAPDQGATFYFTVGEANDS